MSREYTPRPGAAWDTRLVSNERVVLDTTDWADHNAPAAPRPNRAARRAAARQQRKAPR